jgi:vacuolar-type H+-ATPase subunit I/STV1
MTTDDTATRERVVPAAGSHDELRGLAIERLEKRAEFRNHLYAYLLVNGMLSVIWFVTSGGLFWPIFPILGWGIGLTFHALDTYRRPYTEDRIQHEIDRLRGQPPAPR